MRGAAEDGLFPSGQELHHPAVGHSPEADDRESAEPNSDQEELVVG